MVKDARIVVSETIEIDGNPSIELNMDLGYVYVIKDLKPYAVTYRIDNYSSKSIRVHNLREVNWLLTMENVMQKEVKLIDEEVIRLYEA